MVLAGGGKVVKCDTPQALSLINASSPRKKTARALPAGGGACPPAQHPLVSPYCLPGKWWGNTVNSDPCFTEIDWGHRHSMLTLIERKLEQLY